MRSPSNEEIADVFERVAELLEAQHASPYRSRAWRAGAASLLTLEEPVARRVDDDLEALPAIGRSLAAAIRELVRSGRLSFLDRLEGHITPEYLFTTVPGIGEDLAHRIHETLGIETLEQLELAAHDGSLARVPGFGPRRVRAVRESLASMLSRAARRRALGFRRDPAPRPQVATLLSVDAEYRRRAEGGELRCIAPRRFNPSGEAWLPVLHRDLEGWSFHALYSNTARAHALSRTRDWVVLYYERDGEEGQCTVVTETTGRHRGRRVVRGREAECARLEENRCAMSTHVPGC
jgi:hypothetical protein